jgi:hypothetical protein
VRRRHRIAVIARLRQRDAGRDGTAAAARRVQCGGTGFARR